MGRHGLAQRVDIDFNDLNEGETVTDQYRDLGVEIAVVGAPPEFGAGPSTVTIDPMLEDIAGNRLTGLFEKPLGDQQQSNGSPQTITFRPKDVDGQQLCGSNMR